LPCGLVIVDPSRAFAIVAFLTVSGSFVAMPKWQKSLLAPVAGPLSEKSIVSTTQISLAIVFGHFLGIVVGIHDEVTRSET